MLEPALRDEVLADELSAPEGCAIVRAAIYRLLEDDGRPDRVALLASHDSDKPVVDLGVQSLLRREESAFVLDDPNARKARSVREHIVRDRTLRLAVLPAYDFACALCSSRAA